MRRRWSSMTLEDAGRSIDRLRTSAAASPRESVSSLCMMLRTWDLTVCSEMWSAVAISRFAQPVGNVYYYFEQRHTAPA